jgi:hypothetical protein
VCYPVKSLFAWATAGGPPSIVTDVAGADLRENLILTGGPGQWRDVEPRHVPTVTASIVIASRPHARSYLGVEGIAEVLNPPDQRLFPDLNPSSSGPIHAGDMRVAFDKASTDVLLRSAMPPLSALVAEAEDLSCTKRSCCVRLQTARGVALINSGATAPCACAERAGVNIADRGLSAPMNKGLSTLDAARGGQNLVSPDSALRIGVRHFARRKHCPRRQSPANGAWAPLQLAVTGDPRRQRFLRRYWCSGSPAPYEETTGPPRPIAILRSGGALARRPVRVGITICMHMEI